MSNIKTTLETIIRNENLARRQTGRTTRLKEFAKKTDSIFVVANSRQAYYINNVRACGVSMINNFLLGVCDTPIVLDHYASALLFDEALSEIRRLERENAALAGEIKQLCQERLWRS
jgi:hypothetical protein